jgi:hypothetical protein
MDEALLKDGPPGGVRDARGTAMNERDQVTGEILADAGMVEGLRSLGLAHDNLRPLVEAYVQFLLHGPQSRLSPERAVCAVWQAHRASPDFPRFAADHPAFAPEPPPGVFEAFSPPDYALLYMHVAIAEDHLDEALWPNPYPVRFLGITDRQAFWLYGATIVLSAWLIYQTYVGALSWPILILIPLFLAFALARYRQGRVRETSVPLTPQGTREALAEAGSAWPLSSYETGERRRRRIIQQRWRPRAP